MDEKLEQFFAKCRSKHPGLFAIVLVLVAPLILIFCGIGMLQSKIRIFLYKKEDAHYKLGQKKFY